MLIQGIVAGFFFTVAALSADRWWRRRKDKDSLWLALLATAVGALMLVPRTPWYLLLATDLVLLVLLVLGACLLRRTPNSRA